MRKPRSPSRVTKKAFIAARAAEGLWYQNPMSRYEERPTNSQKTNICRMLLASTSPSMDAVNRDM